MAITNPILTFESGGRVFGCDLLWIREILRRPPVRSVECAPKLVRGLIHLRGQILTALDLEARLGIADGTPPTERCIVFKTAAELASLASPPSDAGQAGPDMLGILVDSIGEIIPPGTDILPPPPGTLSGIDPACTSGVVALRDALAIVLKIGSVLAPESPSRALNP
jgi:purine-binding chemotaxis protein CheW